MSDWHKCTEAERELIESCGPDEVCILFGEHGVHKLRRATWGVIYGEACAQALEAAMAAAGVEHSIARTDAGGWSLKSTGAGTLLYADGENFWDWNLSESTVTVRVRMDDGKEVAGVAPINPPGALH
ncbi:hypothetical protein [Luteimonas sp. A501]